MLIIIIILIIIIVIYLMWQPSVTEQFGLLHPLQYGINDPTGGLRRFSNLKSTPYLDNWDYNYPGYLRSFPGYWDYLYVDLIDPTFKRDMYINELSKIYPGVEEGKLPGTGYQFGSGVPLIPNTPVIYPSYPIVVPDQTLPTPLMERYLSRYSIDPSSPIFPLGDPTLYTGDVPFDWSKVTYMPNIQPNLSSEVPHMYKTSEYCVNERLRRSDGTPWETLKTAVGKCTV